MNVKNDKQSDRQTDHVTEKRVGIVETACAAKNDFT